MLLVLRNATDVYKIASHRTKKQNKKSERLYDLKTKHRTLNLGDKVLLFLPCGNNKFNNKWKGPFPVIKQCKHSSVNYVIAIGGKHTIYHINMLGKISMLDQNIYNPISRLYLVSRLYIALMLL